MSNEDLTPSGAGDRATPTPTPSAPPDPSAADVGAAGAGEGPDVEAAAESAPSVSRRQKLMLGAQWCVAFLCSVAFALSFGFNYGLDNQVVYNLGALHLLHPDLYQSDWFVSHTTNYHPTFEYFSAVLLWFSPNGWGFGIATTILISVLGLLMFGLCRVLAGKQGLASFLLVLALAFAVRLRGVGTSYIVDYILQPSTLGSVGFVGAMVAFIARRWTWSGVLLAIGGLFHANYLILGGMVFGFAHLILGGEGLVRRGVRQLLIPALALMVFVPTILKTAGGGDVQVARDLLFHVRSPHHFSPSSYEAHFFPFIGWQLLGIGAALGQPSRDGALERFAALAAALGLTIWGGTAAATFLNSTFAAQLFVQRIAPHLDLLFQTMWAIATIRLALAPNLIKHYSRLALCLVVAGLCTLLMYSGNHNVKGMPRLLLLSAGLVLVTQLVYRLGTLRFLAARIRAAISNRWGVVAHALLLISLTGLVAASAENDLSEITRRSTLLRGLDPKQQDLYAWLREHTPRDAVLLTPPQIEGMRFHSQRAIVVDWKAVPIVPKEIVEWHARLGDVSGTRVRRYNDLNGYYGLDQRRLDTLKRKYNVSYLVTLRGRARALKGQPVYQNAGYAVFKL